MSNKDVQGCANVSRNVTVGGTVSVGGSVLVSHHLVVKGWVDAPHVKGPMKGLYASETALRAAYPRPEPGWFALVGNTLPAAVWRSQSGTWQPTGAQGGEFTIWLDEIESALARDREEITDITERLSAHDTTLSGYGTRITAAENTISNHEGRITAAEKTISNHENRITAAEKTISNHENRIIAAEDTLENQYELIGDLQECASDHGDQLRELEENVVYRREAGAAGGIAPLDETAKVPEVNLPDVVYRREVNASEGVAPLDGTGRVPMANLPATEMFESEVCNWIGRPGGIAPLDESGIVLADHLPDMVLREEVGQPGGVAPLMAAETEGEGTVPLRHLPRAVMNSIITVTIGKAEGIASLDAEAHVPMEQMALGRMMVRVDSEEEMEALIESGKWDENKIYYTVEE